MKITSHYKKFLKNIRNNTMKRIIQIKHIPNTHGQPFRGNMTIDKRQRREWKGKRSVGVCGGLWGSVGVCGALRETVQYNNVTSDYLAVKTGIGQGTILKSYMYTD